MDHIGIDVHKKESQICILAEGGELIKQRTAHIRVPAVSGPDWRQLKGKQERGEDLDLSRRVRDGASSPTETVRPRAPAATACARCRLRTP